MNHKILWTISDSMGTVSDFRMLKSIRDMNMEMSWLHYPVIFRCLIA